MLLRFIHAFIPNYLMFLEPFPRVNRGIAGMF